MNTAERWLILIAFQTAVPILWWVQRGYWRHMRWGEWLTRVGYIATCEAVAFSTGTFLLPHPDSVDLANWRLPVLAAAGLLVLAGCVVRIGELRVDRQSCSGQAPQLPPHRKDIQ